MIHFEINGKLYELRMTFKSIQHLNSLYTGGAMEIIGKAILQDLELFPRVVHAALFHTKENIPMKTVEEEIERQFNEGILTGEYIADILNAMVINHFFYLPTVKKIMKLDKNMSQQLEILLEK